MIDAVLSCHLDPHTCGVAKFNQQLAQRFGVPMLSVGQQPVSHPLVSIKSAEAAEDWPLTAMWYRRYSLFLHDAPRGTCLHEALRRADTVYAANRLIADAVRKYCPDAIEAWCPATLQGRADRGTYRVLVFGMAHKVQTEQFQALKRRLDREHAPYTVALSLAVHEGQPWGGMASEIIETMREIFGDKLRVLGYLGDDALATELQACDAVAAYFAQGVRENNTSIWAAVDAGKTIYTNTDAYSPELKPGVYTWDALVELMTAPSRVHA